MTKRKYKPGDKVFTIMNKQIVESKISAILMFDDDQTRYYITNQYAGPNHKLSYFDIKLNRYSSTYKVATEQDIFKTKQELIDSLEKKEKK